MSQEQQWRLASTRVAVLAKNIPETVTENVVGDFHRILDLFTSATGEDTAMFRIPDSDLRPEAIFAVVSGFGGPGTTVFSPDRRCDRNLFIRKVQETKEYFSAFRPPEQSRRA
jgi:hypothetical protein